MYIELVILNNFLLTYLAGSAAMRLCRGRICAWRFVAASTVGTCIAVFYPFMDGGRAVELVIKFALWAVLSVIMYYKTPSFRAASIVFLLCTFAFGGVAYAIELCAFGHTDNVSTFFGLCGCIAAYGAIRLLAARLRVLRVRAPFEYVVEIEALGTKLMFAAFLDTGNCVYDSETNLPVIVTDVDRFTDKLDTAAATAFLKLRPRLRRISALTPAGEVEICLLRPTRITVYSDRHGHTIDAMVGLAVGQGGRFSRVHEMLIGPETVSEGV